MPPASKNHRAPLLVYMNNFKHGFYSRRIKKRDLTGLESTDVAGLVEEITLIRVFTRRLVESFNPDADFYEHADILRILYVACRHHPPHPGSIPDFFRRSWHETRLLKPSVRTMLSLDPNCHHICRMVTPKVDANILPMFHPTVSSTDEE